MRFFVDRCFPVAMCRAVASLQVGVHEIAYHDDFFAVDATDVEWLRAVGHWTPKPIVISADNRILKNKDELRELVTQDLTFICLKPGWSNMPPIEFAWKFFKAWLEIVPTVAKCRHPTVFEVSTGGALHTEKVDLTRNMS